MRLYSDRGLPADIRATLAARAWKIRLVFQPQWAFKPGPRKLSRVANPDDPWEAWIEPEVFEGFGVIVARGVGATAEEAVRQALACGSDVKSSLGRLGAEIDKLTAAIRR